MDDFERAAALRADALGLHPIARPLGDDHHTDEPLSDEDREIGDALAWFLGTMWADMSYEYWYRKSTPVDEWSRVARALRIHGLKIADRLDLNLESDQLQITTS